MKLSRYWFGLAVLLLLAACTQSTTVDEGDTAVANNPPPTSTVTDLPPTDLPATIAPVDTETVAETTEPPPPTADATAVTTETAVPTDVPLPTRTPDPELVAKYAEYELITLLPPDAIPAIDNPSFLNATEADTFYDPTELIIGVVFNGEARAYSVPLLSNHEIVNDNVGGVKIAVTW
ncbi:MAG: DUF3179 domain-containing protein [Chloroflexi bacterium]|nr:DUF3179 domain-containing protein [Chloroflexota bacterium]